MDSPFLVVANWKANMDSPSAGKWIQKFSALYSLSPAVDVIIAPPFPLLSTVHWPTDISLCAQTVSQFGNGPYTGEVSAELLEKLNIKYALLGHSERRKYFGETTEMVSRQSEQCLQHNITPIICAQNLDEIPLRRLADRDDTYIMYEPFSAISVNGQYNPESPEKIQETLSQWRTKFPHVKFLYGGSVNENSVSLLITSHQSLVTGLVIGHACLDPVEFLNIIDQCQDCLKEN